MECFYHNGTPACGICKSCQRGICRNCCSEVQNGIACLNRCEKNALELDEMIESFKSMQGKSTTLIKSVGLGSGEIFHMVLGILFLGFGLYKHQDFMSYLGAVFLAFGFWGLFRVAKAKSKKNS